METERIVKGLEQLILKELGSDAPSLDLPKLLNAYGRLLGRIKKESGVISEEDRLLYGSPDYYESLMTDERNSDNDGSPILKEDDET